MHSAIHRRAGALLIGLLCLALAVMWLLLTSSCHVHELLVGALSVGLATLFLVPMYTRAQHEFALRPRDVLTLWRIPWYVASSLWEILAVLIRDLVGIEPAPSFYRVCGFRTAREDSLLVTRRALATAYTSVAPNFIVIGVDYNQSRMLFHQIRRSPVPRMTKQLGAEVSHDPRRHPPE